MEATDDLECRALSHEKDYIDIYSNSWGPDDTGYTVVGPGPLTQRALQTGTEEVTYKSNVFLKCTDGGRTVGSEGE